MELVFPGDGGFLPQEIDVYFPWNGGLLPKSWMPYFPEGGGLFPQRDECLYIPDYGGLTPLEIELFSLKMEVFFPRYGCLFFWQWRHFPPKDGAGFPWRCRLFTTRDWCLFPWNGGLFPQRDECLYIPDDGGRIPLEIELFSLKMEVFSPRDECLFFRKWRHFPPEDGVDFPWRWRLFTSKDGWLFSLKRRPFPWGDLGLYFPDSGGLFPYWDGCLYITECGLWRPIPLEDGCLLIFSEMEAVFPLEMELFFLEMKVFSPSGCRYFSFKMDAFLSEKEGLSPPIYSMKIQATYHMKIKSFSPWTVRLFSFGNGGLFLPELGTFFLWKYCMVLAF